MDHGDFNNIFQELLIILFERPLGHDEENDINGADFQGIVLIVEFEDEHGLQVHLEVRLPHYMTALNPNIGVMRTERALRELSLYQWTPEAEYNPLASMLTWQTDVWGVTVHAAGDSSTLGFYPLYIYNPAAAHEEIPMDDEQPGPSHQVNREASHGGSRTPEDQISDSLVESRQGSKRKRKTSGRSESRERKRRSDHQSDSSRDSLISGEMLGETSTIDDQPGFSHRDNRETRARESRALTDHNSQDELCQGGKRKRKTSGRSESREGKQRRSDHQSGSLCESLISEEVLGGTSTIDDQPGFSHRDNREARAKESRALTDHNSQDELCQGGKQKRKTSGRSVSRKGKRRSDHRSDSDSSSDSLT